MTISRKLKPHLTTCFVLAVTVLASSAQAASVTFAQQVNGPVLVSHDNQDWNTFSFTSTNNTATADATLFKYSEQGGLGDGTQVMFLKNNQGAISDLLTAKVHITADDSYSVHYEFYTSSALPSIIPHSTGKYTDMFVSGNTAYLGLQSFSHGIGLTSIPAVPETQSVVMMTVGLLGLIGAASRKRKG